MIAGSNRNLGSEWVAPSVGYAVYCLLFIVAFYTENAELLSLGAMNLLLLLLLANFRSMFSFKKDVTVTIAFLIVALSAVNTLADFDPQQTGYLVKSIACYFLYIFMVSYNYRPLRDSKYQYIILFSLLVIIGLSLLPGNTEDYGGHVRLRGLFVNPNGLAQTAMIILLFNYGERRLSNIFFVIVALGVLGIIYLSATTGAFLAFLVACLYQIHDRIKVRHLLFLLVFALVVVGAGQFGAKFNFFEKIRAQAEVVVANYQSISRNRVDYESLTSNYTAGETSAVWRLSHWSNVLGAFASKDPLTVLIGAGIGRSVIDFGILPHNDYLRVLYEQGVIGFVLTVTFFWHCFHRLRHQDRIVFIMMVVYAMSENVLDNFLVLALFFMFLACAQMSPHPSFSKMPDAFGDAPKI
ncbi:O-antigen ligase family protein [Geomonas silvestris]|uniref:O-antigen ligase family protein n=1 Tax=Geomonas silvestris TaxID=2740184 RepID=UPI001614856A|nr:O-antigen ligase family protein [Geomonas silvestris]